MNMRNVIVACVMLTGFTSFAQTNSEASTLLEEVKNRLLSFEDQHLQFTNIIEFPTGDPNQPRRTRESQGSLVIVGDDYKVDLAGQTILLNGNRAYVIVPDDEEVNVRILEDEDMAFTPNGVLARFESGSSLAMAGKEVIDGKTIQYVKVRPNGSEEIRDIVLGIDMSTKRVYSYTEYGTNDVVTKYVIDNYQVNRGTPASEVRFNRADYDGWRINEPRQRR